MSAGIVCSPSWTRSVHRGACVALESYFKVFAQSLQGFGVFFNPSACWELNQLGLLTNAGNLHSEERISPNQMPCLIRAVDTDNAVTGAGAIYLGLMSTDKSAGWDCRLGKLNLQTAHYRQKHYHHFSAQQFSSLALMHITYTEGNLNTGWNYTGVCFQWYDLGFARGNSGNGCYSSFWVVHH